MDSVTTERVDLADATRELCILEAGVHRGSRGGKPADIEFTEADLAEIARNTEAVKAYLKPPLKLGHDDAQILHGQSDGDPALGWVQSLRADGRKLYATLTNIPERLMELIAKGRYRTMSSEVSHWEGTAWERNVKTGVKGKVLTGLALLGADLPAVSTLDELATLLASDTGQPLVVEGPAGRRVEFAVTLSPLPRNDLAVADARKCAACGADVPDDALTCPKCGAAMSCEEKRTTMATDTENTAKLSDLEAKLAAEAKAREDSDARVAKMAAELETLRTANAEAERRAAEARAKQTDMEAEAFVAKHASEECYKLSTPEAQKLCRALYVTLSHAEPVGAEESVRLHLSATDAPAVTPLLDVLKQFVAALPDQKVLLTQQARTKATSTSDVDDALRPIAEKHKLNLSNKADRAKAIELFSKMSPADRESVKNLGVVVVGE